MKYNFNIAADRKGTSSVKWDLQGEIYGKDNMLPFFIADSDYLTEPKIIESIVNRAKRDGFGYTEADELYFASITDWFAGRHKVNVKREWIIPLSGVVSAMSYLLTICTKPKATVAVQPPVYNPFYTIVQACEKTPVYNHLICERNTYSIDFFNLEELFKTGVEAILFCNPHNPVGRVWSKAELRQLVDLCRKYDVLLISDEIHCDLALYKNQYTSMLSYAEIYDKIIVCTSPGKTFNIAGLHCANIFVPQADLRKKITGWLESRYIFAPNIFAMEACKAAYLNGFQWVDEQKRHLESNHKIITDFFSSGFPQVSIAPLEGTYLTWINLAYTGLTSAELVEAFAQSGAAVSAGKTFGERYDGYIRLNIACPGRQLTEGLDRIGKCLRNIK